MTVTQSRPRMPRPAASPPPVLRVDALRAAVLLLLALTLAACARTAQNPLPAGCTLAKQADVPLRVERNFMLATVSLNGQDATMVVDTGAEATTLTPETVKRLGLPLDGHGSVLRGVSGSVHSANARLRLLAISGMILDSDQSVSVGEMPPFPDIEPPVAGLLGADVLARYEVELDMPNRRMALFTAHGCTGFTPWPEAITVPLHRTTTGLAFVGTVVDGHSVRALVDTGARTTLLTRKTALALGVNAAALAADHTHNGIGIGNASIVFHQHRFAEIGLPGDVEHDMPANITELSLPGIDMLLGADYFDTRHIWISYTSGRLFLQ
jgi:predicted aspartyl protease